MRALFLLAVAVVVATAQQDQGQPPPVQASVGTSTSSYSYLRGQPMLFGGYIAALSGNSSQKELVFNDPNRWGDMNSWVKTLPWQYSQATYIFAITNTSIGLVGPNFTAAFDQWGNWTWTQWYTSCYTATPTVINGMLFVRGDNSTSGMDTIWRLNPATGAIIWWRNLVGVGNAASGVYASGNSTQILVAYSDNIDQIDFATGNSTWHNDAVSTVSDLIVLPSGDIIYNTGSYIYMVSGTNGTRIFFGEYRSLYKSYITAWGWWQGKLWVAGSQSVYIYTALPNYDMVSVDLPNTFQSWHFCGCTNMTLIGAYSGYGRLYGIPANISANNTDVTYMYSTNDYRGSGFTMITMAWLGSWPIWIGSMSSYTYAFNLTSNTSLWRLTSGVSGTPFTTMNNGTWRLIIPYSNSFYLNNTYSPVGTYVNALYRAYLLQPKGTNWWAPTESVPTSSWNTVNAQFQISGDGMYAYTGTTSNGVQVNTWTGATMFSAGGIQSTGGFLLQNMSMTYIQSSSYNLLSYNWSDISMTHTPMAPQMSMNYSPRTAIQGDNMWVYAYSTNDDIFVGNSYNGMLLSKKASKTSTGTLIGFGAYDKKYWYASYSSRYVYYGDADPASTYSATLETKTISVGAATFTPYYLTGPMRYGGLVYAGDNYGTVYAWGRSTAASQFKVQLMNGTYRPTIDILIPFNNQIFAITKSGLGACVAVLSAMSGSVQWTWQDYRYTVQSAQIFADGTMWIRAIRGGYYWTIAIDTTTSNPMARVMFERPMVSGMADMLNGVVWQILDSDTIVGMNAYTGAQLMQIWMDYDYSSFTYIKACNWTNSLLLGTTYAGVFSVQIPAATSAANGGVTPKAIINFAPSTSDPTEAKSMLVYIVIAIIIVIVIVVVIAVLCCRKKSSVAPAPDGYQQHTNVNSV